jgi:hypothetical protein
VPAENKKVPRPAGWSPGFLYQAVVGTAPNRKGKRELKAVLVELAEPLGIRFEPLLEDVKRWRHLDPAWSVRLYRAMNGLPETAEVSAVPDRKQKGKPLENWKTAIPGLYRQTRRLLTACEMAGVSYSAVKRAYRYEKDQNYDADFAKIMAEVEDEIIGLHEERVMDASDIAAGAEDAKTMAYIDLSVLERRDRQRWARNETRTIEGNITHTHEHHVAELRVTAAQYAQEMNRRLFAQRESVIDVEILPALPEPVVAEKGR